MTDKWNKRERRQPRGSLRALKRAAVRCVAQGDTSRPERIAFTLVELLVAISIIGVLAGLAVFALLGAQTDARVARTRGTIQKLNEIILQRWEEYRYRPVNIPPGVATLLVPGSSPPQSAVSPREQARLRMVVLRDMMRLEMPDRISDLLYPPTQYTVALTTGSARKVDRPMPTAWGVIYKSLYNRIAGLRQQGHPNWAGWTLPIDIDNVAPYAGGSIPFADPVAPLTTVPMDQWEAAVQSSELLYLIVANSNYGGSSALEFFRPSEIGDSDEDGLLEFIDAWGQPISWIRWPAGYPGDLVRYADRDAMDPLQTDWRNRPLATIEEDWRTRTLVPLIVSAGDDGQYGVTFDFRPTAGGPGIAYATMTWPMGPTANLPYAGVSGAHYSAGTYYYPDPFATWDYQNSVMNGPNSQVPYPETHVDGYRANQIGSIPSIGREFATDNITNHDILLEP